MGRKNSPEYGMNPAALCKGQIFYMNLRTGMEETSQPASEVMSAQADETPKKGTRRPRTASTRKTRSAKPAAPASPSAEPAVTAVPTDPPQQQDAAEKPKPPRKSSRPPRSKPKSQVPAIQETDGTLVTMTASQPPAVSESAVPQVRPESRPPALVEGGVPAVVEQPDNANPGESGDGTPPKKRRRRGGRGRKRSSAAPAEKAQQDATAADPSAPVDAGEPVASVEQVPDPASESPVERATENTSGAETAPLQQEGGKSRNRGRTSRSRNRKQSERAQSQAQGEDDPGVTAEEDGQTVASDISRDGQEAGYASIPLEADTPALLLNASDSLLEPVSVLDEQEASRNGRSRRRGGRGRGARQSETQPASGQDKQTRSPARALPKTQGKPEVKGRTLLVTVLPEEQVEVVVLENGKVREYYIEMMHQAKIRGNIYKGVVSNIDTNLQAAFVNYGAAKNGFLQIDEVHPEYYLSPVGAGKGHKYPPIQKVMKAGQEVLVQVGKEPTGNKGAFLTTWISLAGRFLVLTPGQEQIGISRKVEDGEERNRLRELIKGLNPGEGVGAIVRTVSAGVTKTTMQKDLSYLKRLWRDIRKKGTQEKAPALIYEEPNLAARSVRDYLTDDVTEVWVDDELTANAMREMVGLLFPRKDDIIKLHSDSRRTLLERFDALDQIEQIHSREVELPSGGRLVFDQTEALMAIDINSGKSGGSGSKANFETMAYRTNLEAAEMIPQQLRLRDIGGQVVIDFIEMRDQSQIREVEKTLRNAMKGDRARHDVGKMSSFGLLQIVRQRTGSSALSISMEACPFCQGTGTRRNMEWQALQALRDLLRKMRDARDSGQTGLVYTVEAELAWYLLNQKRESLTNMEKDLGVHLEIRPARKE